MAITKTLIKQNRQRAIVHLVADTGAGESSTVVLTDLLAADEVSSGTLRSSIASVYCNVSDATSGIVITRGGQEVLRMHAISEWPGMNSMPALDIRNDTAITVTFHMPGTCVLDLRKSDAFLPPNTNVGV